MSNSLDPDQDQQFLETDLSPNSLQRLLADNKLSTRIELKVLDSVNEYMSRVLHQVEYFGVLGTQL